MQEKINFLKPYSAKSLAITTIETAIFEMNNKPLFFLHCFKDEETFVPEYRLFQQFQETQNDCSSKTQWESRSVL